MPRRFDPEGVHPNKTKRRPRRSRAVAIRNPSTPTVAQTEGQAFIAMIERAARDPSVDVSKMKELLAIRNAEHDRVARQAFAQAMVECQDGMRPVAKDMKADRFKYASLEAVDNSLRPIYSRAGFGLSFTSEAIPGEPGRLLIICDVMHRGGYERRYSVPITVSIAGPKGNPIMTQTQGEGAAVSFGRRYLELMIFNIITSEDNAAFDPANASKITEAQLAELVALLRPPGKQAINEPTFCAYLGVDLLANLPVSKFAEAKAALEEKRKAIDSAQS